MVLWRPSRPSRTDTQKWRPFHYHGLEWKSRKSRDTWRNRQIWPWSTEWNRAKANRVLPREHTGHSKHPLPRTQEKTLHMNITRWSTSKSDIIISFAAKDREALYSQQKQDWKLTVAQNLNQIPYDYTMEVTNRVKGLALIDRAPDELWTEVCDIVQETGSKIIPKKKKCKQQNGYLRQPYK